MSNTVAKTAEDTAKAAADAPRRAPEIDPASVVVDSASHVTRQIFVRLPQGLIADDLKEPSIWRRVQASNPRSLRKFDRLTLVQDSEEWLATAIVVSVDATKAVLGKPTIVSIPKRFDAFLEDELYRIEFTSGTYSLIRKRDEHVITREPTLPLAERALRNQYPRMGAVA